MRNAIHKTVHMYIFMWFKEENKTKKEKCQVLTTHFLCITSFASPSLCPRDNTSILIFFFAVHSLAYRYNSPEHITK